MPIHNDYKHSIKVIPEFISYDKWNALNHFRDIPKPSVHKICCYINSVIESVLIETFRTEKANVYTYYDIILNKVNIAICRDNEQIFNVVYKLELMNVAVIFESLNSDYKSLRFNSYDDSFGRFIFV